MALKSSYSENLAQSLANPGQLLYQTASDFPLGQKHPVSIIECIKGSSEFKLKIKKKRLTSFGNCLTNEVTHGCNYTGCTGTVYTTTERQKISTLTAAPQVVP